MLALCIAKAELHLLSLPLLCFSFFTGRMGMEQSFSESGSCVALVGFEFDRWLRLTLNS